MAYIKNKVEWNYVDKIQKKKQKYHKLPQLPHTQQKICKLRIKDKIKFLYLKKATLNKTLYQTHLKLANKWGNAWYLIADSVHNTTKTEVLKHCILTT